ncbi:Putative glycerol-3-phosphate transporter 1 [Linum grandiflorum]
MPEQSSKQQPTKPYGIQLLEWLNGRKPLSYKTHQAIVLIITFLSYASYHAARKTTSIVKSALDPKPSSKSGLSFFQITYVDKPTTTTGWEPFDGENGTGLLGEVDLAFLAFYAFGMFFSGHIGDRMNLRIFLTIGMVGTGVFTSLFGVGYWAKVHNFYYFLTVQMFAGLFQSTGWPSVVAVVGNWCGKKKRGLVMGVWNAHTSVGNISGSLIAAAMLGYGWGWSFVVPGLVIGLVGLVVFLFLPVSPSLVGAQVVKGVDEPLIRCEEKDDEEEEDEAVGFIEAWRIPGVAPFALCLFFAKLVAYTFLYWLPFYISHTAIDGKYLSTETAGNLSTLFDVGGVVGGILAGHISDRLDARAITAASFMSVRQRSLRAHNDGGISRFGHAQLVERQLESVGYSHGHNRRNRFGWGSDRTVVDRLYFGE